MVKRPAARSGKRISISEYDAEHLYHILREHWRGDKKRFGGCYECERLGRRLERLIGPIEVRRIARLLRQHPTNVGADSHIRRASVMGE